jgi:hypothetical protein
MSGGPQRRRGEMDEEIMKHGGMGIVQVCAGMYGYEYMNSS